MASNQNVIVVSINYRLGAHGFLGYNSTYGNTINNGILDQRNAIEWTSRYIQHFGGDPSKITVAGESAGATSVNIHMANEETNELFDKAILESNPAGINLKPSSFQTDLFHKLAKKMGCNGINQNSDDDKMMDCLVALYRYKPTGMSEILNMSSTVTYTNSKTMGSLHSRGYTRYFRWCVDSGE